jgi:hypothetical protein
MLVTAMPNSSSRSRISRNDIANKIPNKHAAPATLRKGQLFHNNKQLDDGSIDSVRDNTKCPLSAIYSGGVKS